MRSMSSMRENGSLGRLVTFDAPRKVRSGAGDTATSAAGSGHALGLQRQGHRHHQVAAGRVADEDDPARVDALVEQPAVGVRAVLHRAGERALGRQAVADHQRAPADRTGQPAAEHPVGADAAHDPPAAVEEHDHRPVGGGAGPPGPLRLHPAGVDLLEPEARRAAAAAPPPRRRGATRRASCRRSTAAPRGRRRPAPAPRSPSARPGPTARSSAAACPTQMTRPFPGRDIAPAGMGPADHRPQGPARQRPFMGCARSPFRHPPRR